MMAHKQGPRLGTPIPDWHGDAGADLNLRLPPQWWASECCPGGVRGVTCHTSGVVRYSYTGVTPPPPSAVSPRPSLRADSAQQVSSLCGESPVARRRCRSAPRGRRMFVQAVALALLSQASAALTPPGFTALDPSNCGGITRCTSASSVSYSNSLVYSTRWVRRVGQRLLLAPFRLTPGAPPVSSQHRPVHRHHDRERLPHRVGRHSHAADQHDFDHVQSDVRPHATPPLRPRADSRPARSATVASRKLSQH